MAIEITDPTYLANTHPDRFERFLMKLIIDPRDIPLIKLVLTVSVSVFPFACLLFLTQDLKWWLVASYWALTCFYFLGPVILMLHNTSHRALFRSQYSFLNHLIPWVVCPFFGETPETYYAHHIGMHHVENNLSDDLSSTLQYRRDSIIDFLHYVLSFTFMGFPQLLNYMKQHRRMKLFRRVLVGELSFYLLVVVLSFVNFQATLVVFVVPFLVTRFGMMTGNWGQHAFVDSRDPGNPFLNSITCINSAYNRRCFNDGYHIGHHLKSSRHWTEMPQDFLRTQDRYIREDAIVFQGLDYFDVWLCLMLKRYAKLASHFVQLGEPRPQEEIIALLRQRTKPIHLLESLNTIS